MGSLGGQVALITGAARGQGRADAVQLAEDGADIIAIDIAEPIESSVAPPATEEDLAETARLIEKTGRRVITVKADVRDFAALEAAVARGVSEFGRLDVVVANAGCWTYGRAHELSEAEWREVVDIVLTGAWNTCRAAIPQLIAQGEGGSIILIASGGATQAIPNLAHYVAAKHGVAGLMKTLAVELAPHSIRVNSVNPGSVSTDAIHNEATYALFAPDIENPTVDQIAERFATQTRLPVPWVESEDVAFAVSFLASPRARYITGIAIPVDAGTLL